MFGSISRRTFVIAGSVAGVLVVIVATLWLLWPSFFSTFFNQKSAKEYPVPQEVLDFLAPSEADKNRPPPPVPPEILASLAASSSTSSTAPAPAVPQDVLTNLAPQ